MKNIFIFFAILFTVISSQAFASGQDVIDLKKVNSSLDSVSNDFAGMQEKINGLIDENSKLEEEHSRLSDEVQRLQDAVKQEEELLQRAMGDTSLQKAQTVLSQKEAALKKLEENMLILQSKNSFYTKELLELQDTQPARKLQLEDLRYHKKSLEMEVKLKDFSTQQTKIKKENEIKAVKDELNKISQENQKVSEAVEDFVTKNEQFPAMIDQLKAENAGFEGQLAKVNAQVSLQEKEVDLLKMKKMYETRSMDDELWPKEKEKADLKEKIAKLQSDLDVLNKKIDDSLIVQKKNRKMTEELIQIDNDNQNLRGKITKIKTKEEGE